MISHHCHRLNAAVGLWWLMAQQTSKQSACGLSPHCWVLSGIHLLSNAMSLICHSTSNRLSIIKTSVYVDSPKSIAPNAWTLTFQIFDIMHYLFVYFCLYFLVLFNKIYWTIAIKKSQNGGRFITNDCLRQWFGSILYKNKQGST